MPLLLPIHFVRRPPLVMNTEPGVGRRRELFSHAAILPRQQNCLSPPAIAGAWVGISL
jgi:hypothetical protein